MYAAPTNPSAQPLETILRPIHEGWLGDARQYLDPALNPAPNSGLGGRRSGI